MLLRQTTTHVGPGPGASKSAAGPVEQEIANIMIAIKQGRVADVKALLGRSIALPVEINRLAVALYHRP
jgi:hypothetical protein